MKLHYFLLLLVVLVLMNSTILFAESDPMRPPMVSTSAKQAAPGWVLNSVLISDERHVAVINQRPVRVGDKINGARVLAIYPDRVRLSRAEKTFLIKLHPLSVKQPVRGQ